MSPEEEPIENFVRKLVLTLHETDNRWNFELFVGNEFLRLPIDNARVFACPEKITGEEFFKILKSLTHACQKLLAKHEKEKS